MGKDTPNRHLNRFSSREDKKSSAEAVYEALGDYLFEKVNLITDTFVTAGSTISTTDYDFSLRVIDTSVRKFMRPDRRLRFRATFYLTNYDKADCYILVPATLDSIVSPVNVSELENYVGLKIKEGLVYLVAKDLGGERVILTDAVIAPSSIATFSESYYLEIQYNITSADFFFDGQKLGTISCNLTENIYTFETFYPLVAPIRSTDGTTVNINMESYQILQDK